MRSRLVALVVALALTGALPIAAHAQQTMQSGGPCPTSGMPLYPGQLCVRIDLTPNQTFIFDAATRRWDQIVTFQGLSGASLTAFGIQGTSGVIGNLYLGVGITNAPATNGNSADLVFGVIAPGEPVVGPGLGMVALHVRSLGAGTCQFMIMVNGLANEAPFGPAFSC